MYMLLPSNRCQEQYNKLLQTQILPMHFTKFLTVSQLQTNAQYISDHLKKPLSSKDPHIEAQSPRTRKRPANQFPPVPPLHSLESPRLDSPQFKLFGSGSFENLGQLGQPYKGRGLPLDPEKERQLYSQQIYRKRSQNDVIYENEQAEKQDQGHPGSKYLFKGSQVGESKLAFKGRKASCNLQCGFFKSPIRKNSDQTAHLDHSKHQKVLIKKKSQGWDEDNNFHFASSNPASQGKSHEELQLHQNYLPEPPLAKNLRKQSQNTQSPKKPTPSFLTSSKRHRNSVDVSQMLHSQKKKQTIHDFVIIRQLGQGSFGRVVLAAEKQSRMLCAIKIMSKRQLRQNRMLDQLLREIKIQIFISHPNIVKVYGFFDDLLHFYIVQECALDGHLSEYIQKTTSIPQLQVGIMMSQICSAVSLLHSESIIHRDLKPQNVLLHDGVVKLCDFGWSVRRDGKLRSTFCGTPVYLSPQILIGDEYDQSVDIWTIGIILYEMIYKTNPFKITSSEDLINILNSLIDFKEGVVISKGARELIESCLAKRAAQRPNIRELMLHQFIINAQSAEEMRLKH